MRISFSTLILSLVLSVSLFLFGALVHGWMSLIIFLLIFIFLVKLSFLYSLFLAIIISGIINILFNFRVFMESLISEIVNKDGLQKYWNEILRFKKNKEKFRVSALIKVGEKEYRVVEFAEYFLDPRAKNKEDLRGFLIFSEKDKTERVSEDIKKKVLGIYLFWRHIYFKNILGDIPLKPLSKKLFENYLKFQEIFKRKIEKRMKNSYEGIEENYATILSELDSEVYLQYPFVKEKTEIEITIFDSLYLLFTQPSESLYNHLIERINKISKLSEEENKIWQKRLNTWEKLTNLFNLKIEALPNSDFKRMSINIFVDLFRYHLTKQKPIISEETIKDLLKEGAKIPRKRILKFLNHYFIYHKMGIDAIKKNIEINKKFKELSAYYSEILKNPPINKLRN